MTPCGAPSHCASPYPPGKVDPPTLLMPEDMTDSFPLRKSHPLAEIEVLQGEGMGYPSEEA